MSFGAPPPGMDEYQRLMAERAARRQAQAHACSRSSAVAVVGGGGVLVPASSARRRPRRRRSWTPAGASPRSDKTEMGAFWNCVMSSEVDVGMFNSADQIQQRIESAYFTQQKTFSDHLIDGVHAQARRARQSAMAGDPRPARRAQAAARQVRGDAAPRCRRGLESYAEKLKGRGAVKDVDQPIQEVGGAFTADPTPESVAFEKFLVCALPDLDKKKDIQDVLQYLADTCKKDAVTFMTKVREECGSLVTASTRTPSQGTADKTFKATPRSSSRRTTAASCRPGSSAASGRARGRRCSTWRTSCWPRATTWRRAPSVVKTAREESARIAGQPLPKEKEKAPGAAPRPERLCAPRDGRARGSRVAPGVGRPCSAP